MLLEPGPLRLVPDAELPRPVVLPLFEALAIAEAQALEGAAVGLSVQQGAMASGAAPDPAIATGSDVTLAAAELASQAATPTTAIAGIAANAGGQEGHLGGLLSEIAGDLGVPVPGAPNIPPGGDTVPPPGTAPGLPDVQTPGGGEPAPIDVGEPPPPSNTPGPIPPAPPDAPPPGPHETPPDDRLPGPGKPDGPEQQI